MWKLKNIFSPKLTVTVPDARAWLERGNVQVSLQQWQSALDCFSEAARLDPESGEAHYNRATLLHRLGQHLPALEGFDAALAIHPDHPGIHAARGTILLALNQLESAAASFKTAIRLKPDFARGYGNLAMTQAKLGQLIEARASHERATLLDPRDAALHFNRGAFLSDRQDWQDAIASYEAAIVVAPDYADAHCNLGLAQQEAGRADDAMQSYARALAINPGLAKAFNNRGNLYRFKKQFAESMADYRNAITLEPRSAEGHYNLAQLCLLLGDFATGWREYEWRHLIEEALTVSPRQLPPPAWFGDASLQGKRIFLHAEQGLGDTIQFCRYAKLVAALGANVTLEVQPALRALLAELDGVSQLTVLGSPIPKVDYHCSLMSLPGAFKTTLETIPANVPYLRADPVRVQRWRDVLGPRKRPLIGVAWRGNPKNTNDPRRRVPLRQLIAHLPDGFDYVCLHNEFQDEDRAILNSYGRIRTVETELEDLTDTAALMECLDLVVSVCTSLAHLSGALCKPTWVMLSFFADWRWLLERRDNPWYPTATLYRQTAENDWGSVLTAVNKDLLAMR